MWSWGKARDYWTGFPVQMKLGDGDGLDREVPREKYAYQGEGSSL